jgi:RNA-directed DNA polymerase
MWMRRTFPRIPFERYADDAICHCKSAEEARALWSAIADRFAACKLVLHRQKTKIVYCKDVNRRGDFPDIHFDFLGFQFRARKIMWVKPGRRIFAHSFQPAASPKALTRISCEIRSWALHQRSDKTLTELAQMYNPCIRGWITYYSHFYKTQLRPTLKRIDAYIIRWARRKFKRMRHQTRQEIGSTGYAGPTQRSLLIGHCVMATAEHREPCDSRGSCTVLGAPRGEIPPGDSTMLSKKPPFLSVIALDCIVE